MILFLLAYLGGALTIVSPCILPVLPFVFARADRSFLKSGLPLLVGMAATFALIATLAAVGGGWAVQANQWGRYIAIGFLALFGLSLLIPSLSNRMTRPLVSLGARLSESADAGARGGGAMVWPSLLLGVATGLLWAPCAGPVLGLILTGAALQGASAKTTLLLLAYALGAATSLALALLIGGRVFVAMKRSLGVGEWVRKGLGVLVLIAVVAIAFGVDTNFLTRISAASTASLEQGLVDKLHAAPPKSTSAASVNGTLPVEGPIPSLAGAVAWINSPPLTMAGLRGKVVLVDFWTYSCINCLRAAPYIEAWADKYKSQGLVVIGVHAPEFAFEKNLANVRKAVADLKITHPVAVDNNDAIWRAFNNNYWPADYFIDAQGRIRHHNYGEGDYAASEQVIQRLLAESGRKASTGLVQVKGSGAEAAANDANLNSPETYIGYGRAERFVSPGGQINDAVHIYSADPVRLNDWGLIGPWTVSPQSASLNGADGAVVYRFHARDLHMVLGPGQAGRPVRFRVLIDGRPPGEDHGIDTDAAGNGEVTGQRLYQLIRQKGAVVDRTFEIRFLTPGLRAYTFTFG